MGDIHEKLKNSFSASLLYMIRLSDIQKELLKNADWPNKISVVETRDFHNERKEGRRIIFDNYRD